MASPCAIEISDDEGEPVPASNPVSPDKGSRVNASQQSRDSYDDAVQSSEEYDCAPAEDYVDLDDVSLHASDIEEGDIFAENLKRYTDLQRQTTERLAAEPAPRSPSPERPRGAAKRPAAEAGGERKRSRTGSVGSAVEEEEDEDVDLELEQLLASSPVKTPTRRGRSGRTRGRPTTDADEVKLVSPVESPLFPPEEPAAGPEPEPEPTFTARVQAGRLIIRLQMKRSDRLQRLFDAVADELSLPSRRVCLGQRDVIYSRHQTPEDVNLGPFDVIEFWEGASAPAPSAAPTPAIDPNSIELKVQNANRRSAVTIRLGRTEAMSVLMERYAREKGVKLRELRFRFDGDALDPTDTPETLDLEGGECIDVHGC